MHAGGDRTGSGAPARRRAGGEAPFAELLRAHRRRAGLTQRQLADLATLGVRTIVDLEQGRVARPQRQSVRLLGDALRLDDEARRQLELTAAGTAGAAEPAGPIAAPAVPGQLPPDPWDFAGREGEVARLMRFLGDGPAAGAAVVSGPPGVGKTALAVHVAHRLRPRFRDGQLFVDLRGTEARPAEPADVLASLLRSLGAAPAAMPAEVDERRTLLRTVVADLAVLFVLDNAVDEAQVRPLLPSGAACRTLVTSRTALLGLESAHPCRLDVLTAAEGIALLANVAGPARVAAEAAAAAAIVELCGRLPLAMRIAGARLASRPTWRLETLAARLGDERRRLDELTAGDLAVRASLSSCYRGLDARARRALRLLASLGVPDFAGWAAAPLLDLPEAGAEALVERLVDAGLLQVGGLDATGLPRYRLHDLIRAYGQERAEDEDTPADRQAAVERAAAAWLRLAWRAAQRLPSAFPSLDRTLPGIGPPAAGPAGVVDAAPRAWLEAEEAALVSLVETAAGSGLGDVAAGIAGVLTSSHLAVRNRFRSWERTSEAVLRATGRSGDRRGEAVLRTRMGQLRGEQDRFAESEAWLDAALGAFSELGDVEGEAAVRVELGALLRETGRFAAASAQLDRAALLARDTGGELPALVSYVRGTVSREQGRDREAIAHLEDALGRYRELGDLRREALLLRSIGLVHRAEGDLELAGALTSAAHGMFLELDDQLLAAYASQSLAKVALRGGAGSEAAMHLRHSARSFRALEDRFGIALWLRTLGELHLATGRLGDARERLTQSWEIWRSLSLPLWEARTLRDLGAVLLRSGDHDGAHRAWTRALSTFIHAGSRDAAELQTWRARWGCECELLPATPGPGSAPTSARGTALPRVSGSPD
jgi:tetratricopeptide (TPR) repeat protein/transcriptional regulator with XRE-family HTH domain